MFKRRTKDKVPTSPATDVAASQNPALFYQEQDQYGTVRTFFETHPAGNRKTRRSRQRHYPYFTKSHHKGRDWWRAQEARIDLIDTGGKDDDSGTSKDK